MATRRPFDMTSFYEDMNRVNPLLEVAHEVALFTKALDERAATAPILQKDLDYMVWATATRGHFASARLLLDRGASPHAEDSDISIFVMLVGAHNGGRFVLEGERMAFCEELVRRGVNVDEDRLRNGRRDRHPLYYCAAFGHVESVRFLLRHGANVNKMTLYEDGETPLHGAANEARLEVVSLLLQAGANPHAASRDGYTVLHAAVSGRDYEGDAQARARLDVIRMLLRLHVDTKIRWRKTPFNRYPQVRGVTPLQMAKHDKRRAIEALLEGL